MIDDARRMQFIKEIAASAIKYDVEVEDSKLESVKAVVEEYLANNDNSLPIGLNNTTITVKRTTSLFS